MPGSEQEWEVKNSDTYPGTTCGFITPDYNLYAIDIYAPGSWYRDHEMFGGALPSGTICEARSLSGAKRAQWCAGQERLPTDTYDADFGFALVEVTLTLGPDHANLTSEQLRAVVESDVAALNFS